MALPPVYTVQLAQGLLSGTGGSVTYTVPDGRSAVLLDLVASIDLNSVTGGSLDVSSGLSPGTFIHLTWPPGFTGPIDWHGRAAFNPGDVIEVVSTCNGGDLAGGFVLTGFLFQVS